MTILWTYSIKNVHSHTQKKINIWQLIKSNACNFRYQRECELVSLMLITGYDAAGLFVWVFYCWGIMHWSMWRTGCFCWLVMFGWWDVPPCCVLWFLGILSTDVHMLVGGGAHVSMSLWWHNVQLGFWCVRDQQILFMWFPMYCAYLNFSVWVIWAYVTLLFLQKRLDSFWFIWMSDIPWTERLRTSHGHYWQYLTNTHYI